MAPGAPSSPATFELDTAELAKMHPGWFAYHTSFRKWMPAAHLRLLADKLVEVATGKCQRLIVNMPPRHGKSSLIAQYFAAWYLSLHPRQRIIFASYADGYARQWGAAARDAFYENGAALFGATVNPKASAKHWEILTNEDGRGWKPSGGYMLSVGIGAGLTGYGGEVIIVDDPVKDHKEAISPVMRDTVWHWFQSVLMPRLQPDGAVIVVMTRWHHDDLVGRLIKQDEDGEGEGWEVLNLPALAEVGELDALGRREGEALWPEAWGADRMEKIRRARGSYIWSALYQGQPTPLTGGLFKSDWFTYYTAIADGDRPAVLLFRVGTILHRVKLSELTTFATVDLASSTKTSADYTVIQTWAIGRGHRLFLLDQIRERVEGPDIVPLLWKAYRKWDLSSIWIEQVNFELSLIQEARGKGLPVRSVRPKGDKVTRALPVTAKMEGGLIMFPQEGAPWWDKFQHELLGFPKAKHDDQVDCLSYAVQVARKIAKAKRQVKATYGGAGNYQAKESPVRKRRARTRVAVRELVVRTGNRAALQATLDALTGGTYTVAQKPDPDGSYAIRAEPRTALRFLRFAIERQGYATVLGERDAH